MSSVLYNHHRNLIGLSFLRLTYNEYHHKRGGKISWNYFKWYAALYIKLNGIC